MVEVLALPNPNVVEVQQCGRCDGTIISGPSPGHGWVAWLMHGQSITQALALALALPLAQPLALTQIETLTTTRTLSQVQTLTLS